MPELDVLYMTRIQQERFESVEEYNRLKDSYVLTAEKMATAKATLSVLHPLPRVNEIAVEVDDDPRANYFEQAANGRYVRMALILKLIKEGKDKKPTTRGEENAALVCKNRRCITQTERGLKHRFVGERCAYCDHIAKKK